MANMRKLAPRLAKLKETYGDDKQKMGQKTMELYKQEKVNPVSGCLPIMVQIPVFIAFYWMLLDTVELRQTAFWWMSDLSAMDPYYILPVVMGISMFMSNQNN
jgi:YidC/Oxa1 family membrane protein insertase